MLRSLCMLLIFTLPVACASIDPSASKVDAQVLLGTWKVDLRPLPGALDYYKTLVVTAVNGKTFSGTFYDSPIDEARINTDWGAVRIAFDTADRSGAYHHSAVLKDGQLEGLSNSTGRNFLSYWRAQKP